MNRRIFISSLTLGLLAAPLAAKAQQPRTSPRLGILLTGSPSDPTKSRELDAFHERLSALGGVEGRTVSVDTP